MKIRTIILISLIISLIKSEEELRWAFEIFRHGARTPYSGMTSDFKDCFGEKWLGLKELTGVGLRQHFLVGYRNRIKYINETNLIKSEYDPREVYLISTDSNRTIMSANAQVQGLYPPGLGPKIESNQSDSAIPPVNFEEIENAKKELDNEDYTALPNRMNVIPVHSFFTKEHFIQLQDKKVCPKTNEYYLKNQQRKEIQDFLEEMTLKYGDKLNEKLIIEDKSKDVLKNYAKAYYIFDTIICRYTEGISLPDLGKPKEELLSDAFKFFELDLIGNGIDHDKDICLYSMSPIFDRILSWINLKIKKDINNEEDYTNYDLPKFVMFSAHDSTCGAFMGFMHEIFDAEIKYPYFATNINLELYRKNNNNNEIKEDDYYIKYIINDEEIIKEIPYKNFIDKLKIKMKTMEEVNEFCGFTKKEEEKKDEGDDIYIWVDVGLGVVSIILIVAIIITIKKKRNSNFNAENMESLQPFNAEN